MDLWEINKIALFLIFFIPGFISIKIYDLFIPSERRDFSKSLFEVMGYSALNFAALSWLIILVHTEGFYSTHKILYFSSLFIVIFVFPIVWPIVFFKLLSCRSISKKIIHPIRKPWDYIFGKKQCFWVIVHLIDGRKIGGRYDTNSFASSYPAEEQIYLEEAWKLDEKGAFKKSIERSGGIIVLGKEISSIEFFI